MNIQQLIATKHTAQNRTLTPETLANMDGYFTHLVIPRTIYAKVRINRDAAMIVTEAMAHAFARGVASSMPTKDNSGPEYSVPALPKVRVEILSPYQYRCEWLANYFNVYTSKIEDMLQQNPAEMTVQNCPVDYSPPDRYAPTTAGKSWIESEEFDQDLADQSSS